MTKQICAKPAAVEATPPKPKTAAISAIAKKVRAQFSLQKFSHPTLSSKRPDCRMVPEVYAKKRARKAGSHDRKAEGTINCTHAATQKLGPCSSFMQANTDHSIGTRLGRRGERAFDDWLQKQLHEMYDSIAQEPLPHDLARLIGDTSEPASQ